MNKYTRVTATAGKSYLCGCDLHPYEPSHPVHCSCNRAESLTTFERYSTPTFIVTLPVIDYAAGVVRGSFRLDCDAVLDSDRGVS